MADISVALMTAIEAKLLEQTATGEALAAVGSYVVLYTMSAAPPDYGMRLPLVVVRLGTITSIPISIPPCMMRKEYPVIFSVFTEDNGDHEDTTAATLVDALEGVFWNESFGISKWVDVTSKNYNETSLESFSGDWNGAGELVVTHIGIDVRSIT